MTNGDYYRTLSNEELAERLVILEEKALDKAYKYLHLIDGDFCFQEEEFEEVKNGFLTWLNAEMEIDCGQFGTYQINGSRQISYVDCRHCRRL